MKSKSKILRGKERLQKMHDRRERDEREREPEEAIQDGDKSVGANIAELKFT